MVKRNLILEPAAARTLRQRIKLWSEWPLAVKLSLSSILVLLPLVAFMVGYFLPTMARQLQASKTKELEQAIQMATSILEDYRKQAETGKLDLATAQKEALARLSHLHYGEEGYLVVTDSNYICLMNGWNPMRVGKYIGSLKDVKGYDFAAAANRISRRQGRAIVDFVWTRQNSKRPIPRRDLFVCYKPWQWTLTSGIFLDLVDAEVNRMKTRVIAVLVLAFALALTLGIAGARKVANPLHDLCAAAARIAEGDANVFIPIRSHDEVGVLTNAFNSMAAHVRQSHERLEARVSERTAELRGEIHERQRVEQALRYSEARYRSVVEQVNEVIFTVDRDGCWSFLNPAWTQITGFTVEECLDQPFLNYMFEEDRSQGLALIESMLKPETLHITREIRCLTRVGGLRWIEMRAQNGTETDTNRDEFFGTLSDITERKQAEEQLQHQALHDALTGLPNRLLFSDRLRGALARAQRSGLGLAVFFVDLDNFKFVNDSMGHEAGDTLLRTIATRLQDCTRTVDTTARMGGDEFTLLLEELHTIEEATQVADRIIARLKQPIRLGEREVFASASIGIVYSSDPNMTPEEILRDADTAMYHAKTGGKAGYVIFDPAMNSGVVQRLEVETGLRFALERNELRVHYQPLVDLQTGEMVGVEALVRWEHPTLGLMMPGSFIPIAEETGLIVPMGYWVLEEACRQVQGWKSFYPAFRGLGVSVNLSGKQLQRADVVEQVRVVLQKTGIAAGEVKLEITESVMMTDVEDILAKLHALKGLGVKLAMDDFGTGYSSMSSLNLLPLDTVKIDRSFVKGMVDEEETRSIVTAIMMLSRALQLDITGEGIETAEQVTCLQGLGCHLGQGYYFSQPLPADVFSEHLLKPQKVFHIDHDEWSREQIEQLLRAS